MKTIQIQRSRPSALALALALLLTMLFVYAVASPALPGRKSDAVSAAAPLSTQLRMEGLETYFSIHSRCEDALQARIHAAQCIESGGSGLILSDGDGYAVVCEVAAGEQQNTLRRSAPGLTLALEGSATELAAVADAIAFLRAQATETGSLAAALEAGETNAASLAALAGVYRTQGQRALDALMALPGQMETDALRAAVSADLSRLAPSAASASGMRLLHAAACAEWISLLQALGEAAG